ncbi:MAG: site-specific integrase, partial [Actinomycetota bacterium]|nr:site-specific integrase [Actinomycetota bacterium]
MSTEGSVFKRKDGRWCAKYRNAEGRWTYLYRKTKTEAKQALREVLKDRDEGIVPANKMTIGMLVEQWLDATSHDVSNRTYINRECLVRNHIKAHPIGSKKIMRITPDDIRRYFKDRLDFGLFPTSVKRTHDILNKAFKLAVSSGYIRRNPLNQVKPPRARAREVEVLTPAQVKHLLETVKGDRFELAIVLGATSALRVGEILSLRHESIDINKGTLTVKHTLWRGKLYLPKTDKSHRTIKLPKIALESIARHRERYGSEGFLFTTRNGNPVSTSYLHTQWKEALRRAGLD